MQTVVHLVRHGEVFNPKKILYGQLSGWHLSKRGITMADAVAAEFADHDITHLVCSPLQRAQETIAPLSRALDLPVQTDEAIIEAGNELQGHRIRGWRSELWKPTMWPLLRNPLTPSWGEPYTEIRDRMMAAVARAQQAAAGHEAVMVSHQLPIVMMQRHLAGKSLAHNPAFRQCELASCTSLIFEQGPADAVPELVEVVYSEPAAGL